MDDYNCKPSCNYNALGLQKAPKQNAMVAEVWTSFFSLFTRAPNDPPGRRCDDAVLTGLNAVFVIMLRFNKNSGKPEATRSARPGAQVTAPLGSALAPSAGDN